MTAVAFHLVAYFVTTPGAFAVVTALSVQSETQMPSNTIGACSAVIPGIVVLSELDGRTRNLFEAVSSCDDSLPLLNFLAINAQTFLTLEDISFNLGLSFARVDTCLRQLTKVGPVRRIEVVGVVLFG